MFLTKPTLAVFDFDGTVGDTFKAHPTAPGVHEATKEAFRKMFGPLGPELLQAVGGLRNRSSAEITEAVVRQGGSHLLDSLRGRLREFSAALDSCVPLGKGVEISQAQWQENPYAVATEIFVREKLRCYRLGRQADGSLWPQPCKGVLLFLERLRYEGVGIGILSSGHELFIRTCFDLWGAEQPRLMLTDDDLRGLSWPPEERTKPHPRLFDLLFERYGQEVERRRVVYFGDDPHKDGLLAERSGIPFGWYNPASRSARIAGFTFTDWAELALC